MTNYLQVEFMVGKSNRLAVFAGAAALLATSAAGAASSEPVKIGAWSLHESAADGRPMLEATSTSLLRKKVGDVQHGTLSLGCDSQDSYVLKVNVPYSMIGGGRVVYLQWRAGDKLGKMVRLPSGSSGDVAVITSQTQIRDFVDDIADTRHLSLNLGRSYVNFELTETEAAVAALKQACSA